MTINLNTASYFENHVEFPVWGTLFLYYFISHIILEINNKKYFILSVLLCSASIFSRIKNLQSKWFISVCMIQQSSCPCSLPELFCNFACSWWSKSESADVTFWLVLSMDLMSITELALVAIPGLYLAQVLQDVSPCWCPLPVQSCLGHQGFYRPCQCPAAFRTKLGWRV